MRQLPYGALVDTLDDYLRIRMCEYRALVEVFGQTFFERTK
jgi:hypothetical protein